MSDLVAFLTARLDEDQLWATEASRRGESAPVEGGVHWRWETTSDDRVVDPDPLTLAYLDDGGHVVSLRSIEEFDTHSLRMLPQFAIGHADDVPTCVGGHIIRHDPARVLREIAAKRAIVEDYLVVMANSAIERTNSGDEAMAAARGLIAKSLRMALLRLAAVWSDHPDFDPAWKVED